MTFLEVIVAVLVLAVSGLGAATLFAYGRSQVHLRNETRVASLLASDVMEQWMARSADELEVGTSEQQRILNEKAFTVTSTIEDLGDVRQVTVTVTWPRRDQQPSLTLVTQVAPQ